jgi:hypothetical protein
LVEEDKCCVGASFECKNEELRLAYLLGGRMFNCNVWIKKENQELHQNGKEWKFIVDFKNGNT